MVKQRWNLLVNDDHTGIIDEVIDGIDVQDFLCRLWQLGWFVGCLPEYSTAKIEQAAEDVVEILNIFKKDIKRSENHANAEVKEKH